MPTPRRALAPVAIFLALCLVACPSPTGSTRKTLVLTGDPALDGAVTWAGASSYSLSFDGDSVAIGELVGLGSALEVSKCGVSEHLIAVG